MKRMELTQKLEEFYKALEMHQQLWGDSLDDTIPRFPQTHLSELRQQTRQLNRMLGALRPFLEKEGGPWLMYHRASGNQWNALDEAVGESVAIVKDDSIRKVLNQLDQVIGKLQSDDPEEEIQFAGDHQEPEEKAASRGQVQLEKPVERAQPIDKSRTVMVVQGRDEGLNKAMFEFLRSLDLHPLEWSEAVAATGNASPYVGQVLNVAFGMAQAVVVLLTGDDMAYLREELHGQSEEPYEVNPTPQARPNVLFEAGMALASHPDETILVEVGTLRPFSDITGRHTVRLDHTLEKRQEVAARLKNAGCAVKMDGKDWHSAGDFTAPRPDEVVVETTSTAKQDSEELSEDDKRVLMILANAGDRRFTDEDVSSDLEVSVEKAKFFLESLEERGLAEHKYGWGKPNTWHLAQQGRKVLVELDLL